MYLIGFGFNGPDVAIIFAFAGILLAAVAAPAIGDALWSTVSVQGVNVSAAVAIFFWPPFIACVFLAFRTHHHVLAVVLLALSGIPPIAWTGLG
jgi:hypothetical protein